MQARHKRSAHAARLLIGRPELFRAALLGVPPGERDGWVDLVFGLGELPGDGPDLPAGCVPYLPCSVDTLLRAVEWAAVGPSDVFVDLGAGVGRAAALVHLLTGAQVVGVEIQAELLLAARQLMNRLGIARASMLAGDAASLAGQADAGTVFFLYCPFSGQRLAEVLAELECLARHRPIRVCTVDLPLPACSWLTLQQVAPTGEVAVYRSGAPR